MATAPEGRVGPGPTAPARVAVPATEARAARRWRVDGPPSGAAGLWPVQEPRVPVPRGPGSVAPAARVLRAREAPGAREAVWERVGGRAGRRA
ncbi:MAG: hypothetical protein ACLP7F_13970 [Acidimicrobiales bacterium]|jgi:hypothetical protein